MRFVKLFEHYNSFELVKNTTYKKLYVSYDIYFLFDYDDVDNVWNMIFGRILGDIDGFLKPDFYKKIKFTMTGMNKPFLLVKNMCEIVEDFLFRKPFETVSITGIYGDDERDMRNADNGIESTRTRLYYRGLTNYLKDDIFKININGNSIYVKKDFNKIEESVDYTNFSLLREDKINCVYQCNDIYFYFRYYSSLNEWDMVFGTLIDDYNKLFDDYDVEEVIDFHTTTGNMNPFSLVKTMCMIIEDFLNRKGDTCVSMMGIYEPGEEQDKPSKRARLYYRGLNNYLKDFKIDLQGSYIYVKKNQINESIEYDTRFIGNFYNLFGENVFVKDVDTWGDDYKVFYITKDGNRHEYVGNEKEIYDDFVETSDSFKIKKPTIVKKKTLKPTKMFNLVYKNGIHSEVVEKNIPYAMCVWYKKKYLREETKYRMGELKIIPV